MEADLEPISGKLRLSCPLTSALADALGELQSGGGVYNPRKLFSQLINIMPQFGGGDQHDSHELLRQLLESVRYVYVFTFLSFFFSLCISSVLMKCVFISNIAQNRRSKALP